MRIPSYMHTIFEFRFIASYTKYKSGVEGFYNANSYYPYSNGSYMGRMYAGIGEGDGNKSNNKKTYIPLSAKFFNYIYNDGKPYSYKPCSDGYDNQCAIRISRALTKGNIDLSNCIGAKCSHGDFVRSQELANFLKINYISTTISTNSNNLTPEQQVFQYLNENKRSAIVFLKNYDSNGSNHIEFVYNGFPKSSYSDVWNATSATIFYFNRP